MFEGDFRYFGDHAELTDNLLFENGGTEGIFSTAYDVFFTSAIIGFLAGETSSEKGDRANKNKTILSAKLVSEQDKTNLIERSILLANEDLDLESEEYGRISRALRNFTEDSIAKKNKKYVIGYALRGIEILNDKLQESKSQDKDVIVFVKELIDEYTSENESYEGIYDLIMEFAR